MRVLTWNVNGWKKIRTYQPWFSLDKWADILDHIGADIICLQETKLTRKQALMDTQMCLPGRGWESVWDFHPSRGYSGTVVYSQSGTVGHPARAEVGITGRKAVAADSEQGIGGETKDCKDELDDDLYHSMDEEGRVTLVDFGFFVLFNLYCPVMGSEERADFRMAFYACVNERARNLLAAGRNVIIVGDINIARAPIDHCDWFIKDTEEGREEFYATPARAWFKRFLQPFGPFYDTARESHPDRRKMYTCWSQLINARSTNYGTRIDYTLVSPGLKDWVKGSDIQADVVGSDHCPAYVDFFDEREIDGRIVKLRDLLSNAPTAPALSASRWEELNVKSLKSFFTKTGSNEVSNGSARASQSESSRIWQPPTRPPPSKVTDIPASPKQDQVKDKQNQTKAASVTSPSPAKKTPAATVPTKAKSKGEEKKDSKQLKLGKFFTSTANANKAAAETLTTNDPVTVPSAASTAPASSTSDSPAKPKLEEGEDRDDVDDVDWEYLASLPDPDAPPGYVGHNGSTSTSSSPSQPQRRPQSSTIATTTTTRRPSSTAQSWSSLFAAPPPPRCPQHDEAAKSYTVNKRDAKNNYGRKFWLCSRPVGEGFEKGFKSQPFVRSAAEEEEVQKDRSSATAAAAGGKEDAFVDPREFRCGFFMWNSEWEKRCRAKRQREQEQEQEQGQGGEFGNRDGSRQGKRVK